MRNLSMLCSVETPIKKDIIHVVEFDMNINFELFWSIYQHR